MRAYFLAHLGIGDFFYCVGALRFLTLFYDKVFCLCKDVNIENLTMVFSNTDKIICIPVRTDIPEIDACKEILHDKYESNDVFICGDYQIPHHHSKITNHDFLNYQVVGKQYTLDCDMINDNVYAFIKHMYNHAKIPLSVMFDYWHIDYTETSKMLYESVRHYRIIFLQTQSSNNKRLNITKLLKKNLCDENTIMISNDENLYEHVDIQTPDIERKRTLCQQFVRNKFVYYIDTLMQSNEIYIIDSCFVGLVLPLYKQNKLIASPLRIIIRRNADSIEL